MSSARARFRALKKELAPEQERGLYALALEGRLGASVLGRFLPDVDVLVTWLERGWIRRAGEARPLSISRHGPVEPAFAPEAGMRQLILRHAQSENALGALSLELEALLPGRTESTLQRKLQAGSLVFRPSQIHTVSRAINLALAESILEPFDGDFLRNIWGEKRAGVAHQVLRFSLIEFRACGDLIEHVASDPQLREDPEIGRAHV